MRKAFTIIELIFVILVLGILASVALPRFGSAKNSADIAKGRADVATIRAAIMNERQSRLILGDASYIEKLSTALTATSLFTGYGTKTLLTYGIKAGTASGDWQYVSTTADTDTYKYYSPNPTTFTYTPATGLFTCEADADDCNALVD